jgi:hypothetical protein
MIKRFLAIEIRLKRVEVIIYVLLGVSISQHPGALAAMAELFKVLGPSGAFASVLH